IGRPLPGRRNIVITRNENYTAEGIETVTSLNAALQLVQDVPEIMIIGGAQIFEQAMSIAEKLYITLIDHEFNGDTYFPRYDAWRLTSSQEAIDSGNGYTFRYCIFEK
ncbi:MAG TPA: dihydrofolate reductase, partial [Solibacillus sp.]